jgi:hypothetical protein
MTLFRLYWDQISFIFYYNMTLKHILQIIYIFNFHLVCMITVNSEALVLIVYSFNI